MNANVHGPNASPSDPQAPPSTPAEIERWEAAGGVWQIDHLGPAVVRILLRRCDGGEVVDVIETADAEVVRWAKWVAA